MKRYQKREFPIAEVRRFLEPGPLLLLSSSWQGKSNIMTLGWHMIMGFEPSLIGCYIWNENYSFDMVRKSGECAINLPEAGLASAAVKIGNCSGREVDKFKAFNFTGVQGEMVGAPLIEECFANFECRLFDEGLIKKYNLFVLEVVKAHVAEAPKFPKTLHYRGDGLFMISGPTVSRYRSLFKPEML